MPPSRHTDNSPPPYPNTSTSSVRRNLFSAHLSRRPASSQSQSQPQSQPQSRPSSSTSNTTQQPAPKLPQRVPSLPHSPRIQDLNSYYNSDLPNPFSPQPLPTNNPASTTSTTNTLFPANSIVAIHPVTGRPILPSLPTLPAHLRLSTDSTDPDHPGSPAAADDAAAAAADYTHSASYWAAIDEQERADKARIEKSLVEMMYRQRKRSQQAQQQQQHGGAGSGSRRGRAGKERDVEDLHCVGAGATGLGPLESEELMGLVMASLRKKVAVLEEERWMFEGGAGGGGGSIGMGDGVEMSSNRYN